MSTVAAESPVIALTESAAVQIAEILGEEKAVKGLRIFVEAGGCSGMSYGMELKEQQPGDAAFEQFGVNLFVDEMSQIYLKGSVIDFSNDLADTGFRITNPNAKRTCGCGTSFEA
jgi:iron-sulfur cluster assembly accessory protein